MDKIKAETVLDTLKELESPGTVPEITDRVAARTGLKSAQIQKTVVNFLNCGVAYGLVQQKNGRFCTGPSQPGEDNEPDREDMCSQVVEHVRGRSRVRVGRSHDRDHRGGRNQRSGSRGQSRSRLKHTQAEGVSRLL